MAPTTMNGEEFYQLLEDGYKNLCANYLALNDLNVFPVPDGDTGTNMKITFSNGLESIKPTMKVSEMSDKFAGGMLFGARGNSGVLSSQYFKGLSVGLKNVEDEVSVEQFARAMISAYKQAYDACADPAEGTILTVAREGIENTLPEITPDDTYLSFMEKVEKHMSKAVDNTPNLLPVLKKAGVVDSGGKGLLVIIQGFVKSLKGEEIDASGLMESIHGGDNSQAQKLDYSVFNEDSELDYGYCTEFLLQLLNKKIDVKSFKVADFIKDISQYGNSLVCFQSGSIVKVHIHTKHPYTVIEFAQRFGEFLTFKMENMSLQHNNVVASQEKKNKVKKDRAIITIAQGDGMIDMFRDMGVDIVLNGGTTMNTSVAEIIDAAKRANARDIFVLPNESNIFMSAHEAANLFKESKLHIIETKNMQEGYSALTMLTGDETTPEEVESVLNNAKNGVLSGFVSKSSRDSYIGETLAPKGSFIEANGKTLVGFKETRVDAVLDLLSKYEDMRDREVLVIFYGQNVTEAEAKEIQSAIKKAYPRLDTGLVNGKQDVYDLLIEMN
jgi:DAK2 domain fusion protein YloV